MPIKGQTITRRHPTEIRDEVERTMRAAGGDVERAALLAGCSVPTYYQRARRAGVDITRLRYDVVETAPVPVPAATSGDVTLTEAGVTLSLADYAILQARAAQAAPAMWDELEQAHRIIASLTRAVETLGRQAQEGRAA